MNKRELNLSGMFQTLEEFFKKNELSFNDKPVIVNVIADLKQRNQNISILNEAQSISTRADFVIKADDKKLLINNAIKVSDGLKVIAAMNKDTRLKIEADISRWELNRSRENEIVVQLKRLFTTALPFAAELMPLGITSEIIDSLDSDTSKLMKSSPAIKNIKVKTKQATAELNQLVLETNNLIRETLDPLMLLFKILDPTLYGEYRNARKIIHVNGGRNAKSDIPITPQ